MRSAPADVWIAHQVREEIRSWSDRARKEVGSLLRHLQNGKRIVFPDMRPMKAIAGGVCELRLSDETGAFRVFYVIVEDGDIVVFHAFKKSSSKTPRHEIKTARIRLAKALEEYRNG